MKKIVTKQQLEASERIFQTAVSLFARQGFAQTGMRELAVEANVNLSMVNYYFGSKKGLLKAILDSFFVGYLAIARKELTGDADLLHSKLERFITHAVSYFEAERDSLIVAISELPHDDPDILEHKADWARQMVEIINVEICEPLAAESGQYILPTMFSPMLTFLMASRFFTTPIIEKVGENSSKAGSIDLYIKTIIRIVLQGITCSDTKVSTACNSGL